MRRGITAFWNFLWEFLIGDTPELLVATMVVVGVALALRHHRTAGLIVVPVITGVALALSTFRGRQRGSRRTST